MFDVELKVKRLSPLAKLPEVAHDGEDLGYDFFAAEDAWIQPGEQVVVDTGLAVDPGEIVVDGEILKLGLIGKQPSGLARKRKLDVKGGVMDAGWRGSYGIMLHNYGSIAQYVVAGDKIAQFVRIPVLTRGEIREVTELSESSRGVHGWGSGHKDAKPNS
jgi:dUTP pyrophosphatase